MAIRATPKVVAALRAADPVMARLIDEHGALVRGTSARAPGRRLRRAAALDRRPAALHEGRRDDLRAHAGAVRRPRAHAEQLLAADPDEIRAAGLSRPKISYLRDLAEHVENGELELERLDELPDEEVIEQLTAVKGIGEWSAHMFLMFHLGRPDVLPVGDQGIRNAVQVQYRLRKLPDAKRLEKIARPWRPYRTLACLYLWSSLDNKPGT